MLVEPILTAWRLTRAQFYENFPRIKTTINFTLLREKILFESALLVKRHFGGVTFIWLVLQKTLQEPDVCLMLQ